MSHRNRRVLRCESIFSIGGRLKLMFQASSMVALMCGRGWYCRGWYTRHTYPIEASSCESPWVKSLIIASLAYAPALALQLKSRVIDMFAVSRRLFHYLRCKWPTIEVASTHYWGEYQDGDHQKQFSSLQVVPKSSDCTVVKNFDTVRFHRTWCDQVVDCNVVCWYQFLKSPRVVWLARRS